MDNRRGSSSSDLFSWQRLFPDLHSCTRQEPFLSLSAPLASYVKEESYRSTSEQFPHFAELDTPAQASSSGPWTESDSLFVKPFLLCPRCLCPSSSSRVLFPLCMRARALSLALSLSLSMCVCARAHVCLCLSACPFLLLPPSPSTFFGVSRSSLESYSEDTGAWQDPTESEDASEQTPLNASTYSAPDPQLPEEDPNAPKWELHPHGKCKHRTHWKHLRAKQQYTYYTCTLCGVKWRQLRPKRTRAKHSNARANATQKADSSGGVDPATATPGMHCPTSLD